MTKLGNSLLAIVLLFFAYPASAEFKISWVEFENGNYEFTLTNIGDEPETITSVIANRRASHPRCKLLPVYAPDWEVTLLRSDIDLKKEGWGRKYIKETTLPFAGIIVGVFSKDICGEILEIKILTEDREVVFTM